MEKKTRTMQAQPKDWTGHTINSAIAAVDKVLVEYIDRPHHSNSPHAKLDAIECMLEFRNRLRREWIRNQRARTLRED